MTGTFENYVCWNRTAANSALTVDAASLPVWLFNAVHHPLMARRRRLEDKEKTGGEWVKESDVVDALRGDLRGDGYLIIPVVGNPARESPISSNGCTDKPRIRPTGTPITSRRTGQA